MTQRNCPGGLVTQYVNYLPAFGELPYFEVGPPFPHKNRRGQMPSFPARSVGNTQAHILGSTKQKHLTPISELEARESLTQGSGAQPERTH